MFNILNDCSVHDHAVARKGAFAASLECFNGIACWLSSEEASTPSWRNSRMSGAGACYRALAVSDRFFANGFKF